MSRFFLITFIFFIYSCSFNTKSSFWSGSKEIDYKTNKNINRLFQTKNSISKEINPKIKININSKFSSGINLKNNQGWVNFDGNLKNMSKYKFSKINTFNEFEPDIGFGNKSIIFFDNKRNILNFDKNSKLLWKKNYYQKNQIKQNPILFFANHKKNLVVADTMGNIFKLNMQDGNLIWDKKNTVSFYSQIKIFNDKIYLADYENTLHCFSLKNGDLIWKLQTEKSFIRSQKKTSIVISDGLIFFNNSIGDITAADINTGDLIWQTSTQPNTIYQEAYSYKASDLVISKNSIIFSNNKNEFFLLDKETGMIQWKQSINSYVRPTIIDNLIFTVSLEGYLVIIDKKSGKILRATDIFDIFKKKKREKILPVGFIVAKNHIYLSTSNGRLLLIDFITGKTKAAYKIDNDKISSPIVLNKSFYLAKDSSIIRLN